MKMTKKLEKAIRRHAHYAINPTGNVGEVFYKTFQDGGCALRIEIKRFDFGNFCDSASIQNLLRNLKVLGVVSKDQQTMWIGMFEGRMFLHCPIKEA